jgi:small subunit ribosomal protein S1
LKDIEVQKKKSSVNYKRTSIRRLKHIYGVFIDLGGVDGLIHITDLSWSRINHPSEVLDQKLNVVILDFDDEKTRIQLIETIKRSPLGCSRC